MIKLILYAAIIVFLIYLLFFIVDRFKRLAPVTQKTILAFGIPWLFNILLSRWRSIFTLLFRSLKK